MYVYVSGIRLSGLYAITVITDVPLYWAEGDESGLKESVCLCMCVLCSIASVFL